jgi:undecaprenyl-diphosphatase
MSKIYGRGASVKEGSDQDVQLEGHRRPWRRFVSARFDPKEYLGLHVTLGFLGALLGVALFSTIMEEVLDNAALVRWDVVQSAAFHSRATAAGLQIFSMLTQLGSPVIVSALGVLVTGWLWRQRRRTLVLACVAAWVGQAILGQSIKHLVQRSRPLYGLAYLHGESFSFPSGHAMGATVAYGMLGYLLVRHVRHRAAPAWLTIIGAGAIVAVVGFSRVYLGVHYPSDVIGGVAAGAAWLAVCITGVEVALHPSAPGRRTGL